MPIVNTMLQPMFTESSNRWVEQRMTFEQVLYQWAGPNLTMRKLLKLRKIVCGVDGSSGPSDFGGMGIPGLQYAGVLRSAARHGQALVGQDWTITNATRNPAV